MPDYFEWLESESRKEDFERWQNRWQRYVVFDESNLERIDGGTEESSEEKRPKEETQEGTDGLGQGDCPH